MNQPWTTIDKKHVAKIHIKEIVGNDGRSHKHKSNLNLVNANEKQCGIMPERETMDAVSMLRRLQEKCHAKRKKSSIHVLWT